MENTESAELINAFYEHQYFISEVYSGRLPDPNPIHLKGPELKSEQEMITKGFDLLKRWGCLNSDGKLCETFRKVLADVAKGRSIVQFSSEDRRGVINRYHEWYHPKGRTES
jgi:hypothetical protein